MSQAHTTHDKNEINTPINSLSVIKQNGLCSVQDLGRMASQHLGFSASGAADEYAFLYANYLLYLTQGLSLKSSSIQNEEFNSHIKNNAQLEITLGQITFKANQSCTIAITGADCSVCINDLPVSNWQVHQLQPNDIVCFNQPKTGLHSYLAVAGGVQNKQWLGSRSQTSTEKSLRFHEEHSKTISQGDNITLSEQCSLDSTNNNEQHSTVTPSISLQLKKVLLKPSCFYQQSNSTLVLRFIPQNNWFALTPKKQQEFCEHLFTITANSSRMGYRLSELPDKIIDDLTETPKLSKPVTFGTIQLPSNGQPIVLMKERQTIGGYPVLGTVIQTDLFKLSQLRPGLQVKFIPTNVQFAQQQLNALHQTFTL